MLCSLRYDVYVFFDHFIPSVGVCIRMFSFLTSTFHSILLNAGRSNPQHKDIDAFQALY